MTPPPVSICVPTYQGGAHLTECLQSIQAQTLSDFEVVLVDDNSTDETFEISSLFASRDKRFKVYRNSTRSGLVGNWNRSIQLSQGKWIKLLFQDDLLSPDCVEQLVSSCSERHGRYFAFCRRHLLFEGQPSEATVESYRKHESILDEIYDGQSYLDGPSFAERYAPKIGWNPVGEPTVTLFHRQLLQRLGSFDPGLVQLCDAEYWVRLASNVGVVHVPEKLATFRVHDRSATSRNLSRRIFRMQTLDPLVLKYLVARKSYYAGLRKVLYAEDGKLQYWRNFAEHAYHIWKQPSLPDSRDDKEHRSEWKDLFRSYPGLVFFILAGFISSCGSAASRRAS